VVAEGLDELVFGHRGAALDARLPRLLAQLPDGLPLQVLAACDLPGLGLTFLALSASASRVARGLALCRWPAAAGSAARLPNARNGADRVGHFTTQAAKPS
jgi:hypothetical protein